ncbi:VCBS domain-containing protein [Vibrio splendidus]|uniref:VCBS domain-containing protein n=1 Tax=Vibrio splendidus TaxID=29497 RepID=UPI001E4E6E3E|nr:VCBS domain-containing protein [Vibrio splendidus]MCC4788373.1 VCBS domain-containing protein [Vibrio splendidus]
MANKKNVEANKKNTEIKNKKSNKLEKKKPTQKKKRRLHSHLKVNIPLFQSLMMILPSLAKHAAAESIDNSSDAADQVTANNVTEKDVTDEHSKADSSAVALQDAQASDNDVNSTLSANHAAHGSSSNLVPSHHLSTLSHPQVHYIPSVSMPTISSGSNGQPTHSNAPTTPALPVTFMPEVIKGTYGELHVDANGQYTFVLNPNSPQYILLNQHQPGTDHFALHLSNGSSIIVQIPVTGKQDTPNISGDLTGVVTEDHNIDSQGLLHANGKIDVIDPDQNENSVTPEVISGKYGSLTIDADGHWQYQVDNSLSNVQALTAATSLHESFTIHTKDGTPQTIDMTIGGNDDNAVITGVDAGTLTEDLTTQVQGQLSVTDSDLGEDHFQASQVTSNFGTLSITKDGAWTYSLDNNNPVVQRLGQGSTATDIVTVHSADGTAHQVMVTINGTNDHAVITSSSANSPSSFFAIGTSNGSSQVTEDKDLTVSGQLNITDIDSKEAHFSNSDLKGTLGTLHLKDNGDWSYDLDNKNPQVQALGQGSTTTDIITIHSADGTPHQIAITVNGTNDKAVISGTSSGAVTEETQLQTSGTLAVTDVDTGEAHFATSSTGSTDIAGSFGTLHLTDTGSWTYDLDNKNPAVQALGKGATATDTITVHSADGTPHQVTITVNGTNDAATVSSATVAIDETDKAVTTSGTLTSTDVDNPDNTFTPDSITGSNGDLTIDASGHWVFTANSAFNQLNVGDKVEETFTVTSVDGTPSTIKVTINGTNDAATVSSATVAIDETDKAVTTSGTLTSTDVDNTDNTFTPDSVVGSNGDLTIDANGHWTFTANSAFNQLNVGDKVEETFTVSSVDGTASTIKVTINGTNDKATVSTATVSVDETDKAVTTSGTLTSTDVDNPDNAFTPDSIAGTNGDLTIDGNGHWSFTANSAFNQLNVGDKVEETFTVSSVDGTTSTIKVTINGTNDKATVSSASVAIDETDKAITTSGTLTSTDVDNPDNTFTPVSLTGTHGGLTIDANGHWVFTAGSAFNQLNIGDKIEETFTVSSIDGTPSTIKVTINGTNDKATVSSATVAIDETDKAVTTSGTLTSIDVDNPDNAFTPDSITGTNGNLTIGANGQWTFTANSAFNQLNVGDKVEETFTVSSVDGTPSTIKVTINGTNDAATVSTATVSVDETDKAVTTSGTLTSIDVDNPDNAFTPDSIRGTNGNLTIDTNGHWTFTANSAFNQLNVGDKVEETFTVSSVDGTASTIKVAINGTNDAATVSSATVAIDETDKAVTTSGTLTSVDVDNPDNEFTPDSISGTNGDLTIDANGHWVFTANSAFNQLNVGDKVEETFTVSSIDGTPSTIKVTINGTNDKAVISGTSAGVVTEESQLKTSGSLTVTDVDAGQAHFSNIDIAGTLGTLHLTDSGTWTYDLDNKNPTVQALGKGTTATDTITVHSADGTPHQITITVNGTNDAAVITGTTTGNVDEGHGSFGDMSPDYAQPGLVKLGQAGLSADGKLDIVDPDTGESQFDSKGGAWNNSYHGQYGHLILNPDGTWHYHVTVGSVDWVSHRNTTVGTTIDELGENQTLTDTITVYSKDGTSHDIVITIHGDNDRPYISSEVTLSTGTEDTALTFTKADLLANTVDVDANDAGKLSIANLLVDHGSVVDNKDGTYTFTPTKDYNGQVHFSYDVTDAHGGITATGANLHLQATGDAATITGIDQGNVTEDRGYIDTQYNLHFDGKLDIVDPDQGEAQFDIQRGHTYHGIGYDTKMGGWVLLQQDGTYTYTIDNRKPEIQNLGSTETLVDKVTIHSVDGTSHEIQITIHGTNDDPKVSSVTTLPAGTEDTDVVLHASDLLANATDIDHNDAGQLSVANLTADHGKITDNHDGTFTFHPALDYNGKVSFTYDVKDAHAGSTATSASMTLAPTSDAAVITGSGSGVKEDINVDISSGHLLGASGVFHVVDPDGPAQSQFPDVLYGGIYQGSHGGDLQVNSNGNYYYHISNYLVQHLSEGETLKEEYTIHSVDGTQHKVEFTVEGTNDKPVLSAQSQSVTEGGTLLSGQMHATDVDTKDTHTFTIDKPVDGLTFNNDGSYTFDPSHASYQNLGVNNDQVIHVQVKVDDHNGGTDTKTLTLVVHGTNDSATIGGQDTFTVQEDHNLTLNSGNTIIYNGQLTITDADAGEDHFDGNRHQNQQTGTWDTGYTTQEGGKLILQSNGSYRYEIDNSLAKIQSLGSSETLIDTVTVRSADGTPHQIQVTIQGDNDAPVVSSAVTLTAGTEDTDVVLHASDLLANATDIDHNDAGKLSVANLIADHGKITDNHDGTFTFHPNQDYNGKVSFTYDVQDAHGGSVATSASITLTPTRDSAVISGDDTGSIKEDHNVGPSSLHPVAASGLLSVTDPDAGQDHFQVNLLLGEQAIHDPFGGFLRITPSGAWGYEVANSRLQSLAEGEVEKVVYRVYSADHTAHDITITVTGTNDQPSITATTLAHGTEDTHYQMQVSQFGFSDIDTGDTLHSIAITDLPSATQGKFVLDGHDVTAGQHIPTADISKLQFIPAQDFNGDVQFKYTVNDGHDDSQEATNTLHIDAVGDKAVISGVDTGDVYENRNPDMSPDFAQSGMAHLTNSMIHVGGQLTIIDPDTGENSFDSKGIGYTYHGKYGHLILNTDGKWFYGVATGTADVNGGLTTNVGSTIDQLGANETLTDTITIQSKDGTTHDIVITIHGDNDRPYCSSEVQLNSGKEDLAQTITATELLANTIDVDSNDLGKLTIANLLVDHGSVVDNKDGTYTFTPTKDYNGQVHFTYDVTDAHGGTTHTGANTSLAAVNDVATFTGDSGSIREDTNIHHNAHITGSATIPDALSCHGHLIVSDADGHGEAALDLKGQPKISLDGTYGHFDITSTGTWVYKADNKSTQIQDLDNGQTLTDSIEVTSKDGTKHSITVTINGTTDDPVLHSLSDSGVQHSGPVEGNLLTGSGTDQGLSGAATDTDSNAHLVLQDIQIKDPVSGYVAVRPGQPHTMAGIGTLAIEANGHYTFTPEAGFTGKVPSMVYRVGDDGGNPIGDSSQNSLSIEVTPPLQHAPTVTGQTVSTNEDITRTFTTSEFGYSDQDGDTLQFVTISSIPSHGLLLLNGNAVTANQQISKADLDAGHLTFTPISNENGANYAQFTFTANDGHKNSASATMVVDVNAVNDAPIVGSSFISSLEDKPHAFTTADFKYSDIDGDALNHITITNVAHGVLSLNGTTVNVGDDVSASDVSSLIFTPTHNYFSSGVSGLGAVQFTANDGHLDSKEGSILINIASVADPATFSGDSTGVAKEDITLQASGTLTASDPDGTAGFTAVQGGAGIAGSKGYGHAHIDVNGHWTYDLDNNHPIVQQLGEGQTDTETITVQSADGTHHDIVVTITGTNDAPILGVNQTSSTAGTLTETDVDVYDTHTFSIVSSTGQFGSLSVDPNTGDYIYTPNTSITGMSYNSATNSYHGVDVFEVKVSDGHTEDSKFITFDASGHVTMSPTGSLVTSTTVPHQPVVTATQPTLPSGTNVAPTNTVTLDLASTSDSGSSQTDNLTNDTTPTITGHTDIPFSKVTIYDGSTPVGHSVSDASGQYSVAVSSLSEGEHNLSAKALAPSSVLPATSSLLSVHIDTQVHVGIQTDPITADNVINAQESNSSIDITGSVSGDYNSGDIVTLDVNGTQHTGVVDAKGHYSIAVPGSELIADADQKIEASVAVTDTAGNSAHATADVTYQVDTQVSVPTITFENAGADNLYSKAEIARGQANTITATVTPPGDAKIGEHLIVNGQDHVLDAHTLQHGIQIEVHPGSNVQATMTDEHGNTAGSQGFAASAIPEPIIVRPPSGSHQVSGTLGVPPLLPSLTPVPTAQSGWRIHLPNGQYVTSHHGQYGTLTIDPQTGHLHYQEQAQVHTGPHGSASGIGQHEDKFEVALQGSNQDEVVAHVNIQILSHGPGNSGKLTVGTEVVDMTITPLVHTSHPAPPPPPPVQHDEPDMASQADFTVTLSDDSNLDLTQQTHQEPDQKTSHHGAAAYLDALGITPDPTSTTVHDQPADMDIVLAQVDHQDATTHDQAHLDMSDALEHHDANVNHNQDDEHHHHNDVDGLPDIDPNS